MHSNKKINYKDLLLPVVFILLLVITIIFHQKAFSQNKEALGTEVSVKVIDIKTKSQGLNPGGLAVTVSYRGEKYKLYGVPSNAHFIMENSKKYGSTISVKLYSGKLYYDSASIKLLSDKLYYAFLLATLLVFSLMFVKMKEKQQGSR